MVVDGDLWLLDVDFVVIFDGLWLLDVDLS